MEIERFKRLVSRLERESAASAWRYRLKVAALALLGVGVIGVVLSAAGFGLLLLAALGVALLWKGGVLLLLLLKFAKLLIFLAVPLWLLVRSSLHALFVRLPPPAGLAVGRADAPALFEALDRMRRRLKGPPVHQVLLVDQLNAAIVQRPMFGLVGWPRNHLLLGLPLLDSLAPDEALAVVAHEYGHLAGSHGRFGAFIYRLRLSWATIDAVASQWKGLAGGLLRRLVGWYVPYFNAYTFVLARANEFEADRASVDLVGAAAAAAALKRVNLAGAHHEAFLGQAFEQVIHAPQPPADLQARWAEVSGRSAAQPQAARWLGDALDREGQWHDTHPTPRAPVGAARRCAGPGAAAAGTHRTVRCRSLAGGAVAVLARSAAGRVDRACRRALAPAPPGGLAAAPAPGRAARAGRTQCRRAARMPAPAGPARALARAGRRGGGFQRRPRRSRPRAVPGRRAAAGPCRRRRPRPGGAGDGAGCRGHQARLRALPCLPGRAARSPCRGLCRALARP